jgi:hypothetical protein
MERRKYHRLYFSLPMELQVRLQDGQEAWTSDGLLQNLSLGGVYFVCDTLPRLRRGDVGEFILQVGGPGGASRLRAAGQVKRVDHHVFGFTSYGIAVEFLSQPLAH